jgi:hypothetical protein
LSLVITPKKKLKKRSRVTKRTYTNEKPKLSTQDLRGKNCRTFIDRNESTAADDYLLVKDQKHHTTGFNINVDRKELVVARKSSMDNPNTKVLKASLLKVNNYGYEMSLTKELKGLISYKMFSDIVNKHAFKYNKENLDKVIYIDYRNVFFENKEKNSFRPNDKIKDKYDIKSNNIKILTSLLILILIIGIICTFLLIYT